MSAFHEAEEKIADALIEYAAVLAREFAVDADPQHDDPPGHGWISEQDGHAFVGNMAAMKTELETVAGDAVQDAVRAWEDKAKARVIYGYKRQQEYDAAPIGLKGIFYRDDLIEARRTNLLMDCDPDNRPELELALDEADLSDGPPTLPPTLRVQR
jgi:hypothetical protein